jgi:hypothetical protein
MMAPLNRWQKILAYGSLLFVLAWTLFGIFAIWLVQTES